MWKTKTMEQEYKEKCTREWNLLHESNGVQLYRFFDMLDWEWQHAICFNGTVVPVEENGGTQPYVIFEIVAKLHEGGK